MTQQDEELDYMVFLARSPLPALKTLSIFTWISVSTNLEPVFVDFMQSKSHIKTLELQMAPDAYEAVIPHVNTRTLVLHLPKPSLVGLLNAALQKLQLVCHSRPGSIQDIYNIFDGLVKESRRLDILRLIDVGQSFTWFSDEEPLTVFGNVS
jgi:hypothetical protein